MRELHGVIHLSNIAESLKKSALLFDQIWATQEFDFTVRARYPQTIYDDLEFLQEVGFLCLLPSELIALALKREPTEAMKREEEDLAAITNKILFGDNLPDPSLPKSPKIVLSAHDPEGTLKNPPRVGRYARLRPSPMLTLQNEKMWDNMVRRIAVELNEGPAKLNSAPICKHQLPCAADRKTETVLHLAAKVMPQPDEASSWQDIFDFRKEMRDKQWVFRRFLHSLATKPQSEAEIRDDIEWSISEYQKAMDHYHIKASHSFVDVFLITPLEILENLMKFNWSKIAKGALSVKKRQVELMEAEMKAPGRECAYVFDARKRFGGK